MDHPTSVTRATRLLLALMALGLVITVLVVVLGDELLDAWSAGHPPDSAIKPLVIVPVVVVMYVVVAGLVLVLLPFLRSAHNWARHSLAAIVVAIMIATLAGIRTDPPTLYVVCSVATLVLDAAILYYLFHRDTGRYVTDDLAGAPRT